MITRLESALQDGSLRKLVEEMISEGYSQLEIHEIFYQFCLLLRKQGREKEEDETADMLDYIIGWCSPHNLLFSHYLTNEEIEEFQQANQNKDYLIP